MTEALIMAAGRSERMRARGDATHKALVPVLGFPMAERNLRSLLKYGFRSLAISMSANEPTVIEYAEETLRPLARREAGTLKCIIEMMPLGTIVAVRELADVSEMLLVVNADNLTALNLRKFVVYHRTNRASMTVVCHYEPFKVPFGELHVSGGRVVRYLEKPTHSVLVSSGTYVLSHVAI